MWSWSWWLRWLRLSCGSARLAEISTFQSLFVTQVLQSNQGKRPAPWTTGPGKWSQPGPYREPPPGPRRGRAKRKASEKRTGGKSEMGRGRKDLLCMLFNQFHSSRKIFPQSNLMKLNSGTCGIPPWSLFCQSGHCFKSLLWFSQLLFPVKTFQSVGKNKESKNSLQWANIWQHYHCIQPRTVRKSALYYTHVLLGCEYVHAHKAYENERSVYSLVFTN